MRIARDLGTVSHLLPVGVRTIREAPYPLFQAIKRALIFLSFEELMDGDMPPRKIWMDNEDLSRHFEELRREKQEDSGGAMRDMKRNAILQDVIS